MLKMLNYLFLNRLCPFCFSLSQKWSLCLLMWAVLSLNRVKTHHTYACTILYYCHEGKNASKTYTWTELIGFPHLPNVRQIYW